MNAFDLNMLGPLIQTLGWTLLHFLWQGAAIGVLFALGRLLIEVTNSNANGRYLFGLFCLSLAGMAPILTFLWLWESPGIGVATVAALPTISVTVSDFNAASSISMWVENSLPWLVLAWAIGVVALSARVLVSWRRARRMTHDGVRALDRQLLHRVRGIAEQFGITRGIRIVESALVQVPTVIGWLKPIILLPTSSLTCLTPTQLELVIAHELGHIRRFDYVVNLLQVALETLLFYHPVVRWISTDVRAAREVCCDDLVVKQCGQPTEYAKALLHLESMRGQVVAPGLAATEGPLLQRIQRMLDRPGKVKVTETVPVPGHGVALGTLVLVAVAGVQGFQSESVAAIELTPVDSESEAQLVLEAKDSVEARRIVPIEDLTDSLANDSISSTTLESIATPPEQQSTHADNPSLPDSAEIADPQQISQRADQQQLAPDASDAEDVTDVTATTTEEQNQLQVASSQLKSAPTMAQTTKPEAAETKAIDPNPVQQEVEPIAMVDTHLSTTQPVQVEEGIAEDLKDAAVIEQSTDSEVPAVIEQSTDSQVPAVIELPERLELAKIEPPAEASEEKVTIRPVHTAPADYPRVAERHGREGYVVIEYTIKKNGKIGNMTVVESNERGIFDTAAKRALREWRYSKSDAAQADGMKFTQRFNFTMTNTPANNCLTFTGSRICRG